MPRTLIGPLALLIMALPACTHADSTGQIDITKLTCDDFLATDIIVRRYSGPERQAIASLLSGYMLAKKGHNEVVPESLLRLGDMLEEACREGAFGDRPMLEAMLQDVTLQ